MAKEQERGLKKVLKSERTVFNDEEQRRYVLHYKNCPFIGVFFLNGLSLV